MPPAALESSTSSTPTAHDPRSLPSTSSWRTPSPVPDPLAILGALVLEDGHRWGDDAAKFQWLDARAIFGDGPLWHFLTRPRGGSKTTDLAGIALAWLAVLAAPVRSPLCFPAREPEKPREAGAGAGKRSAEGVFASHV